MGKVKSAICLVLATLLIAALSFVCFVPFRYGRGGMYEFDPIITWTAKESNLGVQFGAGEGEYYVGGGYSATYYPEGVISAREYEDNLSGMEEGKDKDEYIAKYTKVGALYFDEEHIEDGEVSETFKTGFSTALAKLKERYSRMNIEGLRMDVVDGYTVRVFVPQTASGGNGYTALFSMFAYSGDLEVQYGADETSAVTVIPTLREPDITTFVSDAYTMSDASGNNYVVVKFTTEGKNILAAQSASAAESEGVLLFKMGDDTVIRLTISEAISDSRIFISNPSSPFTSEQAKSLAVLFDSALEGEQSPLSFSYEDVGNYRALGGDNALMLLYIAFGVCFVGMMAFFFARYHLLGFVHLYTYLLFLLVTLLCLWGIPFISLSAGTLAAVLLMSLVLSFSQVAVYEKARKDRASGKTLTISIKSAYKRCFWHIFDLHIVLALIGFITYAIALSGLAMFAFVIGLTAVFSGICSLAVGRFLWAVMMTFPHNKNAFCNFKGEEEKVNG